MNQYMTRAEIEAQFQSEFVLVENIKQTPQLAVLGGTVIWHSKDRDEVYDKAVELRPKNFTVLYTGTIPDDVIFAL